MHVNKIADSNCDATFHQLTKPTLSIQRKCLEKIEREIGLRKWSKVESIPNESILQNHIFINADLETNEICLTEERISKINEPLSSGIKTMDLFNKARDALNNSQSHKYTDNIINKVIKDHPKVREIQPMQKRGGLWKKAEQPKEDTEDVIKSPKSTKSNKSSKPKIEIPFSKNRYINDAQNPEILEQTKKKAIKFLKNQKEQKKLKDSERRKLIEKRREYTEQVRKINKVKLTKTKRKRNNSAEGRNSENKNIRKSTAEVRSKSHEVRARSGKPTRKFIRKRLDKSHHSENKGNDSSAKINYITTLSVDEEPNRNVVNRELPPRYENRVSINVDLVAKLNQNHKEILSLNQIDNSEQKISIEEEDTKYMKTPELNDSDQKLSEHSTEKGESKRTRRGNSSQKKRSIKVAQEILECKRDLIKMQRISEIRKHKISEENDQNREIERRKQNLESLNEMLKKRNKHFKRKKRNQEKLLKKDLNNFEKSIGVSFTKKTKKKKLNIKNIRRDQTFSCLSSKGQGDTINSSKNRIITDENRRNIISELRISSKKDKINKVIDSSNSVIYSPNSKPTLSSQKKSRKYGISTGKKRMNESMKTNASSNKLMSANKLVTKSCNNSQFLKPQRGYDNEYKKKKAIQSETKKSHTGGITQINNISEIQEFNVTDEESLINSSILKNIDDHESIHRDGITKQKTKKKAKAGLSIKKSSKKMTSSKKNTNKKRQKSQGESGKNTDKKSSKKRKVIFHISKPKETFSRIDEQQAEQCDFDDTIPANRKGQIKKVDFHPQTDEKYYDEDSEEIINVQFKQSPEKTHINQEFEKIEMINSERLSELLSSKKKHRYRQVEDSMDGMVDTNVHQQINFNDEEQDFKYEIRNSEVFDERNNSKIHESIRYDNESNLMMSYHSPGVSSSSPDKRESIIQNFDNISEVNDHDEFVNANINPEKEFVIESISFKQLQIEKNDVIDNTSEEDDEHQTVINCTQSDETITEQNESNISDRNIIVDEFSLEYTEQEIKSSNHIPKISIDKIENEIKEQQVYNYEDQKESFTSNQDEESYLHYESEEEEEEITSRIEYPLSQHREEDHFMDSNNSFEGDLIKEVEEDSLYDDSTVHRPLNYFEKTLTNMRLAFGSEKHIRENSVKTLEKMEHSQKESNSGDKTEEKSSIFEKKSFQDFSLKKFTELMQVKNMKNFQNSMQKTFREYNKDKILTASEKKPSGRMSSTPKKSSCISPRKFSMRDLELDRIGYEKMKEHSEKKNEFIKQIIGSSSSQNKFNNTSILYKTNLSFDKCKREINMHEISEDTHHSLRNIEYKVLSPKKKQRNQNNDSCNLIELQQPKFESPEQSRSNPSNPSSCKQILNHESKESIDQSSLETPYEGNIINSLFLIEDDNIETVKLDSSRLRSQKRGLPIDESEKDETPKGTNTQRRIIHTEESCYTGEKYVLGDCFTDEKIYEMKLRNAVTSAKKINPLQILKDLKSPATSSYISSAKKALMKEETYDDNDRIDFNISDRKYPIREFKDKENIRDNHNILISRFNNPENDDAALKNYVNANKFQIIEQDYNKLISPEKSHHKHSKSRSRTKEKRGNRSEGEPDKYEINPIEGFSEPEDNTCMMIDFSNSPEPTKHRTEQDELEETSKSLEWILAKNIDKKKRDEICKIIGEEESRNTMQDDKLGSNSHERHLQEIEVEEVTRVRFGNQLINNNHIGHEYKEDTNDSNLGQYIECLESVESSATNSVKGYAERDLLKDIEGTTEYMTDEILSMMLFNDIHDCPMHPIRENNFIDYFKDKYPFNRDLGIDTTNVGTTDFIDSF